MNIPDEAVVEAANAISMCSGMRFDGFWFSVENMEPEDREYALMQARAALEAAAPLIASEVLYEAACAFPKIPKPDPFQWLAARSVGVLD